MFWRVMSMKLENEGVIFNVVSGHGPQVGHGGNLHRGNIGDADVMSRFGMQDRKTEGQIVVDSAKRKEITVYFYGCIILSSRRGQNIR